MARNQLILHAITGLWLSLLLIIMLVVVQIASATHNHDFPSASANYSHALSVENSDHQVIDGLDPLEKDHKDTPPPCSTCILGTQSDDIDLEPMELNDGPLIGIILLATCPTEFLSVSQDHLFQISEILPVQFAKSRSQTPRAPPVLA